MRVGSIVHFVPVRQEYGNQILPQTNTNYTVREIFNPNDRLAENINGIAFCDVHMIYLEEIVNPVRTLYLQLSFEEPYYMQNFKELLPPIENIEEHINENTLAPVLI